MLTPVARNGPSEAVLLENEPALSSSVDVTVVANKPTAGKRFGQWFRKGSPKSNLSTSSNTSCFSPKISEDPSLEPPLSTLSVTSGLARRQPLNPVPLNTSVRVYNSNKEAKLLDIVKLVQVLPGHDGPVWVMKFSHDGKLLATAGQDGNIFVWAVADGDSSSRPSSPSSLPSPQTASANGGLDIFKERPVMSFVGPPEDILDLSWSRGQFLLSASVDNTVRLWHMNEHECVREFVHSDFVTSVEFHPTDQSVFVSGTLDGKICVWNILEKKQLACVCVHQEGVTAVTFSKDGGRVVVGTMGGHCRFYNFAGGKLDYVAQVDCKNSRGVHASGRRITRIQPFPGHDDKFLISSNDSRIRVFSVVGFTPLAKFKGHKNLISQVQAFASSSGSHILSGSDDGWTYMWQAFPTGVEKSSVTNNTCAGFVASDVSTTVALMMPQSAGKVGLSGSGKSVCGLFVVTGVDGRVRVFLSS